MACDKSWGSEVLVTLHTTLNLKAGAASANNDSINTIIKISLRFLHKKRMGAGKPPKSSWSYRMKFLAADFVQSRPSVTILAPLFQYLPLSFHTFPCFSILGPVLLYLSLSFYTHPCLSLFVPLSVYLSLSLCTCSSLCVLVPLSLYLSLSLCTCRSLSILAPLFLYLFSLSVLSVSFYTCPSLSTPSCSLFLYLSVSFL